MATTTLDPPAPGAPTSARAGPRLRYLPGLDGLRAFAVVAVVLYHAEVDWIPGGFLGVEVFFVISGYLITALLLAEWKRTSLAPDGSAARPRIDLRNFWVRRARRLLPALFLLLAVCSVVTLVFHPEEVASFRGDAAAALTYVTNWYAIVVEQSYFEFAGRPPMLQHLWSLAVEEQFYLVWPLLFVGGMRLLGKNRMLVAVLAVAGGSVLLMRFLHDPAVDPSRVYYGTDTRAFGLLFGAALAFVWAPWRLRRATGRGAGLLLDVVGVLALARLAQIMLTRDEFDPWIYSTGLPSVSLLTVVVIAVVAHPAARLGRVLGVAPLVWIGLRSYGIYLWHWPVIVLTRPGLDVDLDGLPLLALRLAITVVLAELSYRFVEMPVRRGAIGRWLRSFRRPTRASEAVRPPRAPWGLRLGGAVVAVLLLAGSALLINALVVADPEEPEVALASSEVVTVDPDALPPVPGADATPSTGASTTQPDATDPTAAGPTTTAAPPVDDETWLAHVRLTAVGDSVMLGAKPSLQHVFPLGTVDAEVGRAPIAGIGWLSGRGGDFGDVVVVHLGNNGVFRDGQFDELMTMLRDVKRVIVVNVKLPRRYEGEVNGQITEGIVRYPNAVLADWYSYSTPNPQWFYSDGMHLKPEGQAAYTHLIVSTLLSYRPEGIVVPPPTTTTTLPPTTEPPTTLPPTTVPPSTEPPPTDPVGPPSPAEPPQTAVSEPAPLPDSED